MRLLAHYADLRLRGTDARVDGRRDRIRQPGQSCGTASATGRFSCRCRLRNPCDPARSASLWPAEFECRYSRWCNVARLATQRNRLCRGPPGVRWIDGACVVSVSRRRALPLAQRAEVLNGSCHTSIALLLRTWLYCRERYGIVLVRCLRSRR